MRSKKYFSFRCNFSYTSDASFHTLQMHFSIHFRCNFSYTSDASFHTLQMHFCIHFRCKFSYISDACLHTLQMHKIFTGREVLTGMAHHTSLHTFKTKCKKYLFENRHAMENDIYIYRWVLYSHVDLLKWLVFTCGLWFGFYLGLFIYFYLYSICQSQSLLGKQQAYVFFCMYVLLKKLLWINKWNSIPF